MPVDSANGIDLVDQFDFEMFTRASRVFLIRATILRREYLKYPDCIKVYHAL